MTKHDEDAIIQILGNHRDDVLVRRSRDGMFTAITVEELATGRVIGTMNSFGPEGVEAEVEDGETK